jgi:predicted O-methyltransferase YrrM
VLENLRPGAWLLNAFRRGRCWTRAGDPRVVATQHFNQRLASDPRLISSVFPGGDGIALAVLREPA